MAAISASICSIWSWSLRSSEGIGKQYSIDIVYGVENHKKYKTMSFRTDRTSANSAREPYIWSMMPRKVIYKPN